jgi:hypothetical protein
MQNQVKMEFNLEERAEFRVKKRSDAMKEQENL